MTRQQISEKNQRKHERASYKERLTNWYMLNLTYGVLGIIILLIIGSCYKNIAMVSNMQVVNWTLTAGFAAAAIALVALGAAGVIKNRKRANNYAILLGVCAVVGLWLSLYNRIRIVMETAARAILGNPDFVLTSYWNTRIPIILIAAYLVISFIVYVVKIAKK